MNVKSHSFVQQLLIACPILYLKMLLSDIIVLIHIVWYCSEVIITIVIEK